MRKILHIHVVLLHEADAEVCDYRVPVALVRDDRQRHRVHRTVWRAYEHCARVVLSGHVAYVSIFLDDVLDAMALSQNVIEYEMRAFAQTQYAHAVRRLHARQRELHADELVIAVDFHALALCLENARLFAGVLALAHVTFFVRTGYDGHRVRARLRQAREHLEDADLGHEPAELSGAVRLRHVCREHQIAVDCIADDANVDGLGAFVAGITLELCGAFALQLSPILRQ